MPGILKKIENEKKSDVVEGSGESNLSSRAADVSAEPQPIHLTALQRLSILAAIIAFQDRIDKEEEEDESDSESGTDDSDSDWYEDDYFYSSAPFRPYSLETARLEPQMIDETEEELLAERRRLRRFNKKSENCDRRPN
uniref:Uncharacterized protein n=1 Tax=Bactrocera latifrons TaxID=174628 RepID=A0A0K8VQ76_BACLA